MYDVLNINEDKPTAQQTWNNLYNIQEKDWKKIYTLNNTYKCAHINGLISSLILVRSFSNFSTNINDMYVIKLHLFYFE